MENQILTDGSAVYYVVMKDGKPVSEKFSNQMVAENVRVALPVNLREGSVVVAVDASGKMLLNE